MNADGLAVQPKQPMAPPPNKIGRLVEQYSYILTPEETATLRVAIVALVKLEKRIAWNQGAEWQDQQWWSSDYATGRIDSKYWGFVEPTENPYREFGQ